MAMVPESKYESPLTARYCKDSPLRDILSERNKTILWRQLWIWLAEAKMELGLKQINEAQIIEMRANRDQIDFAVIRAEERRLKHDVMAHNRAFGKVCPSAAGIVHLGATSCYVQDNADLIVQREACDHLLRRLAICLHRLDEFAQLHQDTVTVGRTHFQTASLVTVGKRAVLWAQELLEAFNQLRKFRLEMRFRGVKGATGTQDSFLTLFDGDEGMVEHLDELVTKKAGFGNNRFVITGQTYPRMQDVQLLNALAALGAATQKICGDIRMLQAFGELLEPFEPDQVGSSAMPYKRNPMKAERCCGLARLLIDAPQKALLTQANQGFERTLDDSSARRIYIPDSLLTAEAILMTLQTIFEGMTVQEKAVKRLVETELPFLALEKALMWLTEGGHDRQMAHEKIRAVALSAREVQKERTITVADILSDGIFDPIRDRLIALANEPLKFTGRCQSQTILYLKQELRPAIAQYLTEKFETKMVLDV